LRGSRILISRLRIRYMIYPRKRIRPVMMPSAGCTAQAMTVSQTKKPPMMIVSIVSMSDAHDDDGAQCYAEQEKPKRTMVTVADMASRVEKWRH